MPNPMAPEVVLTPDEREQLELYAAGGPEREPLRLRARIVLCAAEGRSNTDVAELLGVHRNTVIMWRRRFVDLRLDGLLDKPRPGRPRTVTSEQIRDVLIKSRQAPPPPATRWSTRLLAEEVGLTQSAVHRIWRQAGPNGRRDVAPAPAATTEDFRRRLLDGLAQSIRERGLQGTQVSDIVRHARTSKSKFYECFGDKETCFAELIEEWTRETLDVVGPAVDPEASWEEQLESAVDAYLDALTSDPVLAVTISWELPALGARGAKIQEQEIDGYARLIMEITRRPAMRRAGVEPVTFDTAVMVIGGIAELLDRAVREKRPLGPVGETIKSVMKRVIGPQPTV